jgi:hypothetical protein
MTSYIAGLNFVERERRRPATTSSGARQTRKVFRDAARKWLPILEFINIYNRFIKGVNTANQMRSYYTSLRIYRRTWKPLFHSLLNTTVTNAYKLSSMCTRGWVHHASHKAFREALINSLLKHSASQARADRAQVTMEDIQWYPVIYHGYKAVKINQKQKACSACLATGRKSRIKKLSNRKPLCELSANTTKRSHDSKDFKRPQRAPRTTYGCRLCRMPLCKDGPCWQEHVDRLNSKE